MTPINMGTLFKRARSKAAKPPLDSTQAKTVGLDGPVTIYEVAGLKEAFREAMAEGKDLRVELDESTKWDLAGVQLLVSCVKTARGEGRRLTLAKVPRACVEVAERAGLSAWLEAATEPE